MMGNSLANDVPLDSAFRIPIVDFAPFRRATAAPSERRRVADDLVNAFKEVGFVYLSGHGIPTDVIDNVYAKSAAFFGLPQDAKDQVAWTDPRENRGYVRVGRERVTQSYDPADIAALRAHAPDTKESIELGNDTDPTRKNKWPNEADVPGFRDTIRAFFQTCHALYVAVMRALALGLGLPETFFDGKIDRQFHNLRLLSYPPVSAKVLAQPGQARAGAHSDYGNITLLFQDSVGGLEVQHPQTHDFQPVHPVPGTIVVNVGDLLARWSNDVLRSTLHRVVAPPAYQRGDTAGMTPWRQSIACFCRPNPDVVITALPTCVSATHPSKYEPVLTEDFVVGRLTATYE